jgi:hypothetical protein
MVIKIDLGSLPANLKSIVTADIRLQCDRYSREITNPEVQDSHDKNGGDNAYNVIVIDEYENTKMKDIEREVKDILIKRRISEYVPIRTDENKNGIVIVPRHQAEHIGLYHCRHCGMTFEDEIHLVTHQRIHFFM